MHVSKTSTFYDEHPFDWTEAYAPDELWSLISPLLLKTIDALPSPALALDLGCGPGRVMGYLASKGMRCVGVDMSSVSIKLMTERFHQPGVVGDNLALPIQDRVADVIISDGVIHHTGDPCHAFQENCRVLKSGGLMYLAVYKPGERYEFIYKYPGRAIRWALQRPIAKPLVHLVALPAYYAAHLVKSRGKRTWRGAQNLFYDYFITPKVAFLSYETIEAWADECGIRIISYDRNARGNVHCFVLQKNEQ